MAARVEDTALTRWCRDALGSEPSKMLFSRQRSGDVVGYRLADGRRVVVKARREPLDRVRACMQLQSALFAAHYPCPRPLTDASVVDGLTVHAEEYVDGGEQFFGDATILAAPLAAAFADLTDRLDRLRPLVHVDALVPPLWISWWSQRPWSQQPQVPGFVYEAANRVRARLGQVYLPGVVSHADWASQNLRWSRGRLVMVYDWDSLAWAPEAIHVGAAAAIFPAQDQPETAALEASAVFLERYQETRGREFSTDEVEVAWAAGLLPSLFHARAEALEGRRPVVLDRLQDECADRLRLANA